MKLQVLVTTMHQKDIEKYRQMNLQTDAVIANQCDDNRYLQQEINGHTIQLISTTTRGTSRNRNIALAHSDKEADLVLFSDDDLVFNDGYVQKVIDEFEKHPDAEAIKFNLHDLSDTRKISMKKIIKFEKATRRNMSSSGVCGLAIKQETLLKQSLHFHEYFGSGTKNYCGEDTLFLMEMLKKRIKFYRSPIDIAGIDQTESTWFQGHDERYFETAGMVLGTAFPLLSYFLAIRSAYRFSKRDNCHLGFWKTMKCYYRGLRKHV